MKRTTLLQFKANQKGRVSEILGRPGLQNKLMSMGVYKGKEVTKVSHIGLRGPVVIKVGRSILALGHSIAASIIIES